MLSHIDSIFRVDTRSDLTDRAHIRHALNSRYGLAHSAGIPRVLAVLHTLLVGALHALGHLSEVFAEFLPLIRRLVMEGIKDAHYSGLASRGARARTHECCRGSGALAEPLSVHQGVNPVLAQDCDQVAVAMPAAHGAHDVLE